MIELFLAAVVLLATHFGVSSTGLRPWLLARLGTGRYLGLYSVVALLALAWLVSAFRRADHVALWAPASWHVWLAILLTLVAFMLLITGLTTPNPTVAGAAFRTGQIAQPRGVLRITRHPTMWAFALWGIGHIVANGDLAALIMFGTITVLALVGTRLIDARYEAKLANDWRNFATTTSNLPFAAILAGRQSLALGEIGGWRIALAVGVFVVVLGAHPWLFGVAPLQSL